MADNEFDFNLNNPENPQISDDEIRKELEEASEKEFLDAVKKKNSKTLIKLDVLERERIAKHITGLFDSRKADQEKLSKDIDEWDQVYRMEPISLKEDDGESPTYRSPVSTVNLEVIHANVMNVFFTPKDIMRVLPTEKGDIPKVDKLDTFGNYSMKNELMLFEHIDRLFHMSGKNGETPYIVHWVKEIGTEIEINTIPDPINPDRLVLDPITKEPLTQEREVPKILYNGPRLEIFSRKDYILPKSAVWGKIPPWELRIVRLDANTVRRRELEGKYYNGIFDDIGGWGTEALTDPNNKLIDKDSDEIPLGKTEKLYVEFYGRLRINQIKKDENDDESYEELEDEFIAVVEIKSETLCELRKNRFPMKMRPIGLDTFLPDDLRLGGIGVMEIMDGVQRKIDTLTNQFTFGTVQANNPFGFFTPTGNMRDEPIKTKSGYLYPTSDPKSINMVTIPPPDASLQVAINNALQESQLIFGLSSFAAGVESRIDPDAPAKKVQFIVAQGNVRLNTIIKRKNSTLKDIFKKWFLLYQANMPPNKFMRIVGEDKKTPWQFEPINATDFALKSLPDFELTGNVLNTNKQLEVNKALAIYQVLITNPFFAPQTSQGLQALHALTKWLIDKFDEIGISSFLPSVPGEQVQTPEEENARFMQGDKGEPTENEPHPQHIKVHRPLLDDQTIPEDIKKEVLRHIQAHIEMMRKLFTQQAVLGQGGQGGQGG